ncbi:glutaredoxin family protein [Rummeliibacillus suwonensis]|uniref:glutaredoxin family protein n=1 Tax=Rummeliibacillus suwonensis TaxID=1306154 RepID=UPI0011B6C138|nr:glutaredoxin family protein [Rummeliibacillus suwonensis]MBO2536661.1 glutaredoxin family protein [Rummeliibacillus suwonensis]
MAENLSIVVWAKKGCSYCNEVKEYLTAEKQDFKVVDVTDHDEFRDILDIKYGVRHVPVVEIGRNDTYQAVTEVGIEHLQKALQEADLAVH